MDVTITLEARALARKTPIVGDWQLAIDPMPNEQVLTLRGFIERVVRDEVAAFRERQAERRFARVLSPIQVEAGARLGKIAMGGHDLQQAVDVEEAIQTAIQAFEDGTYLVLIDGAQLTDLDDQVKLHLDSRVTFVRLVALAGG